MIWQYNDAQQIFQLWLEMAQNEPQVLTKDGRFSVFHPTIIQSGSFTIYDATGRTIIQQNLEPHHGLTVIESDKMTAGVYLLVINIDDKTFRHKVVIE